MGTMQSNFSLKEYNTFGIEAYTEQFIAIDSTAELIKILKENKAVPFRILGGGSNILLTQNFSGIHIHLVNKGIEIIQETERSVLVEVHAGENWHEFVLWCLKHNFGGVENLALIPGNVGAAPIQNIGAYGVEIKDVFHSCNVLEVATLTEKKYPKKKCHFEYRSSIFKTTAKGKYIILSVLLELQKAPHTTNTSYGAIASYLKDKEPTIQNIATAVMEIRKSKLPDPKEIGNSGSFFKNPTILKSEYTTLKKRYAELPHYSVSDKIVKIPAGWLIDYLGLKGYREGDAGVHQNQALVLVNYGNAKGTELLRLSKQIQNKVKEAFGIDLETEVNIL